MNDIAGIPYVEAQFNKDGSLANLDQAKLPPGVTDLFVISHGWNNDDNEARGLYQRLFENFKALNQPGDFPGRSFAILGVIWPSKKFDELVAVSGAPGGAEGQAALKPKVDKASDQALSAKLEEMKKFFTEPAQHKTLDEAEALLPAIDEKGSARQEFVNKIRSLLDPAMADMGDASETFFKDDGNELMKNLKVDEDDLDEEVAGPGGSVSLPLGVGAVHAPEGGAAGLAAFFSGFKASAMNILNYTTYYEMKARAGNVGKNGVAKLIENLAPQVQRIHLIGHSFGGRVVTAAAANSSTDKIKSMSLLQTAFSHNGFSKSMKGFFRSVVDQKRVKGPILVTHTKNDKAVGLAYPLASRINHEIAADFGDENDKFGGLGRNGAQKMENDEVIKGNLLAAGGNYSFQAGKFFNLEGSPFIKGHGDVTGEEIAHAVRKAISG